MLYMRAGQLGASMAAAKVELLASCRSRRSKFSTILAYFAEAQLFAQSTVFLGEMVRPARKAPAGPSLHHQHCHTFITPAMRECLTTASLTGLKSASHYES